MRHRVPLALLLALVTLGFVAAPAVGQSSTRQSGSYHPQLLLVGFEPGVPAAVRAAAHAVLGGQPEHRLVWRELDVVRLPPGLDPAVAADRYTRLPGVAYAHPNWRVRLLQETLAAPNDPLFARQWGLQDIDAPEGWGAAFPQGFPAGDGTRVGILDTGIDQAHDDLRGKTKACASALAGVLGLGLVLEGICRDDSGHGTHVAGTVGATTDNGIGVAGTAPNAEFAVFKGINAAGYGFIADVIAGIHWLRTTGGARIINMSFGGAPPSQALNDELSDAAKEGVLLLAAAGNDGGTTTSYPASHEDVVSVAAMDKDGTAAAFSTCNEDVDIAAPGVEVWSTTPGNAYLPLSGTSMATAHVSGVAALVMWTMDLPADRRAPVTRALLTSAPRRTMSCARTSVAQGEVTFTYPVVNLETALKLAVGGSASEQTAGTIPPPGDSTTTDTGNVLDAIGRRLGAILARGAGTLVEPSPILGGR